MKVIDIFIVLFLGLTSVKVKAFNYPDFVTKAQTVQGFLPNGWSIKKQTAGDMNKDGLPDVCLIAEYKNKVKETRGEGMENEARPRILVILFKTAGGYTKALQHNTVIVREGEGGMEPDPETMLEIEKGILKLSVQFVRSSATYKVRYQKGEFYLIGFSYGGVEQVTKVVGWDVNFSTGVAVYTEESLEDTNIGIKKSYHLPKGTIKQLNELRFLFSWKVLDNLYV